MEDILDGSYVHPYINTRVARLKIRDQIIQLQNELHVSEISTINIIKYLQQVLHSVVNKLNNSLPILG